MGKCAHCGYYSDDGVVIEQDPDEDDWVMQTWKRLGFVGKFICSECYLK